MSKRSKLALILAMLLGASTVISACGGGGDGYSSSPDSSSENSSSESTITPAEEEELANEEYKERIDKWMQYVEYDKPDNSWKEWETTQLTAKDTNDKTTAVNVHSKVYVTTEKGEMHEWFSEPDPTYVPDPDAPDTDVVPTIEVLKKTGEYIKTTVYAKETDEVIGTFTQNVYELTDGDTKLLDPDKKKSDEVLYAFDYSLHANVLGVTKTSYKAKELPAVDPDNPDDPNADIDPEEFYALVENYEKVVTYTYYDVTTGKVIAENLETEAVSRAENVVDIGDKTYVMNEDGIAKVFDLSMEYTLPTFDKTNQQSAAIPGAGGIYVCYYDEYVYFEQGDYGYRIDEEEVQGGKNSGDFGRVIYPGVSVNVYKDYNLVATYETDAFMVWGYTVLPNGNVYFCEARLLSEDATEYDFSDTINKYDLVHTILDVTTGATSEVDNDFITSTIYTDSTKEINTTLQKSTLGVNDVLDTLKVKDGYVLAEIQTFTDGALTGESVFAVLDSETMEFVDELPKIVDTQFGYAGFVSENEMLFMTKTFDNKQVYYTANVETGDLQLIAKSTQNRMQLLQNECFLLDKKVYDYSFNLVVDLSEYRTVKVIDNGKLLLGWESDYTSNDRTVAWYVGFIVDDYSKPTNKTLSTSQIFYDSIYDYTETLCEVIYDDDGYFTVVDRDNNATYIYSLSIGSSYASKTKLFESSGKTVELRDEGYYQYVEYYVTTTVSMELLAEGKYLVEVSEYWAYIDEYGYDYDESPSEEVMANNRQTYYTYYIMNQE